MSSRKRRAINHLDHRKPSYYSTCPTCGVRQGKLLNHYQQSPRCCPTGAQTKLTSNQKSNNMSQYVDNLQDMINKFYDNQDSSDDNFGNNSDNSSTDTTSSVTNVVNDPTIIDPNNGTNQQEIQYTDVLGQEIYVPTDHSLYDITMGDQEYSLLRIYDFCEKASCPRYFFDDIMKVIREEVKLRQFDVMSSHLYSRKRLVKMMMQDFPSPSPTITKTVLKQPLNSTIPNNNNPHQSVADVIHYDFLESLTGLLNDRSIFGCTDNLVVNSENPFYPYEPSSTELLDEVLDGQWYKDTVN